MDKFEDVIKLDDKGIDELLELSIKWNKSDWFLMVLMEKLRRVEIDY